MAIIERVASRQGWPLRGVTLYVVYQNDDAVFSTVVLLSNMLCTCRSVIACMLTVSISWLHRGVLSGQHWLTGHQHSMTTVMLRMQVSLNRSIVHAHRVEVVLEFMIFTI